MERKELTKEIGEERELDVHCRLTGGRNLIDEIIKYLNSAKENGATHIEVEGGGGSGDIYYATLMPVKVTLENDNNIKEAFRETEEYAVYIPDQPNRPLIDDIIIHGLFIGLSGSPFLTKHYERLSGLPVSQSNDLLEFTVSKDYVQVVKNIQCEDYINIDYGGVKFIGNMIHIENDGKCTINVEEI